jgi:hypothetical protein
MMARPTKVLTEAQKAEVETLAAVLNAAQMADYFAIGRTTFFAMMERDGEIAERYKRGKARAIGAIAQGLIAKARGGDTASMIFYLKTQAGWRETTTVEHSVADAVDADVAFQTLAAMLDQCTVTPQRRAITLSATAEDTDAIEPGSHAMARAQGPAAR